MKTPEGKEKWRNFINAYENKVTIAELPARSRGCSLLFEIDKYNFGSLIRTDATDEYSQFNSIFGPLLLARPPVY